MAHRVQPKKSARDLITGGSQRPPSGKSLASELAPALAPLVDLALAAALTSPELERILRSVFVERAAALLDRTASRRRGGGPSDLRIGLMIGVSRNIVHSIRASRRFQVEETRRPHPGEALLKAWTTDWTYLTEAGLPRELPIYGVGREVSFEALVRSHLRGVSTGTALAELRRCGAVQLIPDERVRLLSRTMRSVGIGHASIAAAAERLQDLGATVLHNLAAKDAARFCEAMDGLDVAAERVGIARQTIARRARDFLDGLAAELASLAPTSASAPRLKIGLTVFAHESEAQGRPKRGRRR